MILDKKYWTDRYNTHQTQWDIGYASPALLNYMKGKPLDAAILIPGAGNAYEAEALWNKGFKNITVLDISEKPLQQFKKRVPDFPEEQLLCVDFFEFEGQFDIILEQTFFCALNPQFRANYAQKMAELLKPDGELAGLLFGVPMNADNPPFGGSKELYLDIFSSHLHVIEMENTASSIAPRMGKELFFRAELKNNGTDCQ